MSQCAMNAAFPGHITINLKWDNAAELDLSSVEGLISLQRDRLLDLISVV